MEAGALYFSMYFRNILSILSEVTLDRGLCEFNQKKDSSTTAKIAVRTGNLNFTIILLDEYYNIPAPEFCHWYTADVIIKP